MLVNEDTRIDLSLDWDELLDSETSSGGHPDSIPDALIMSLTNRGKVDIGYIIDITGQDYDSVISSLKGSVFQNPDKWDEDPYKGWETADEYLSGNLRTKLRAARRANRVYKGRFSENTFALRKVLPEALDSDEIYVTLGSPWVPVSVIEDFISYILRIGGRKPMTVVRDDYTGTWEIKDKYAYAIMYNVHARSAYGTSRMDALEILEKTLNMRSVAVYDKVKTTLTKSGEKRVLNQPETVLAIEKQQKLIDTFRSWVWTDKNRKEKLEGIFDSKYGSVRRRIFDGSFLKFPGMSESVQLYPYQKNAVARVLFSPNTLLAHDVGSGKTYVMIAAGMELKRMGLSSKNLYVVPNNIVMQWKGFFDQMYPDARVLCVEAKNFTPERREATLRSIRDGEWDAIIMAYSCFDRIPLSKAALMRELQEKRDQIKEIEESGAKLTKAIRRKKEELGKDMEKLNSVVSKLSADLCFDALGITRLFVDEAHNYKNVPLDTGNDRVLGVSAGGSKKCKDMMDKVHFIQRSNDGGGVVMATGTPITNSLTEAFVMQKYLQEGELAMLDLHSFDNWVGMFAERVTEFEVDVDTSSYRLATRYARFHNLPELTALLSSIADFHQVDECVDIPDFDGYSDTLIERTNRFKRYLEGISKRADSVRHGFVSRKEDNMLKITTDGRKAALDLRLVDDEAEYTYRSKVARCAENAFVTYLKSAEQKGTQLIFCDSSTPKDGFNIYDEMRRLLIDMGVREEDIAYVHDATTEAQRARLFDGVRRGDIRILLGSTFKLGTGVNVQDRLIAIHHLDLPWRPSDMTQRQGRILRQGNLNDKVYIYRYITEGSFDAYSWQLLETKQRFISELLSGSLADRSGSDVDEVVLSYAEVKALAIGNPKVKERVETANELSRIRALHKKDTENRIRLEKELLEIPARIEHQSRIVERCLADVRWMRASRTESDKDTRKELRTELADAIATHLAERPEEDLTVMTYQGFDIVLPADMTAERPYLWLMHEGKYYVELGDSGQGAIIRVDNYLEKLPEHYRRLRDGLADLKAKQRAMKDELDRNEDYADRIDKLKSRLEKLDKELGVKSK